MKKAFIYSTIVAIGGFIFGLDAALISGTVNYITQEFSLTELELGTAVSAPGWGVLVALLFTGYASNHLGRKKSIQIIALLYLISAIGSALAPSYWVLVTARFLGGLAFTSISLASMYIGEISPSKIRGKLVSMTQINIVVGLSAAYFINYYINNAVNSNASWVEKLAVDENVWRWMLGSEILPALIWFILLLFIPKSPAWLLLQNRDEEAKDTLSQLVPKEEVDNHLKEMKEGMSQIDSDQSMVSQLKELVSRPMKVTLIIAVTIAIAQQATGINAILFYAPTVFEQLGMGTDAAFVQAIWIGLTSVVFTILGLLLVDKLGRKPLIVYGMIWIIASLGLCAYGFANAEYSISNKEIAELSSVLEAEKLSVIEDVKFGSDIDFKDRLKEILGEEPVRTHGSLLLQKAAKMNAGLILFGILSFIAAFHFSVGPVMWVLFSEIFPLSLRGTAIPAIVLITSTVSVLVQKFFPWQLATMGVTAIFLFYAGAVTIGLIILSRYLIETKGMSIEEIQQKLIVK